MSEAVVKMMVALPPYESDTILDMSVERLKTNCMDPQIPEAYKDLLGAKEGKKFSEEMQEKVSNIMAKASLCISIQSTLRFLESENPNWQLYKAGLAL